MTSLILAQNRQKSSPQIGHHSIPYPTKKPFPLKSELRLILSKHEGRRQAITSRELSGITGADDRRIRLTIRELRADGFPVLSSSFSPAGFYLPLSWKELEDCLALPPCVRDLLRTPGRGGTLKFTVRII
jgi:hypothetical protein